MILSYPLHESQLKTTILVYLLVLRSKQKNIRANLARVRSSRYLILY